MHDVYQLPWPPPSVLSKRVEDREISWLLVVVICLQVSRFLQTFNSNLTVPQKPVALSGERGGDPRILICDSPCRDPDAFLDGNACIDGECPIFLGLRDD